MRKRLTMAGELRPGDPGLALGAQAAVLRLAKAQRIGVELTHGMLMRPHKSTSMVLGVGIDLPATAWSRCDDCPSNTKCALCRPRELRLKRWLRSPSRAVRSRNLVVTPWAKLCVITKATASKFITSDDLSHC